MLPRQYKPRVYENQTGGAVRSLCTGEDVLILVLLWLGWLSWKIMTLNERFIKHSCVERLQ